MACVTKVALYGPHCRRNQMDKPKGLLVLQWWTHGRQLCCSCSILLEWHCSTQSTWHHVHKVQDRQAPAVQRPAARRVKKYSCQPTNKSSLLFYAATCLQRLEGELRTWPGPKLHILSSFCSAASCMPRLEGQREGAKDLTRSLAIQTVARFAAEGRAQIRIYLCDHT